MCLFFFFSSRRRHTRWPRDWSSDVCSSDLVLGVVQETRVVVRQVDRLASQSVPENLLVDAEHVFDLVRLQDEQLARKVRLEQEALIRFQVNPERLCANSSSGVQIDARGEQIQLRADPERGVVPIQRSESRNR